MKCNETIGQRIGKLRANSGLTQAELANKLSVKRETVAQWEADTREIKASYIIKLAELFNVSADYILAISDIEEHDIQLKEVSRYFGVSENTVQGLKCNIDRMHEMFGYMLESEELSNSAIEKFFDSSDLILYDIAKSIVDKRIIEDLKSIIDSEASRKHRNEMYFKTVQRNTDVEFADFLIYKDIVSYCEIASKKMPLFLDERQKDVIKSSKNIGEVLFIACQSGHHIFERKARTLIEEYFGEDIKAIILKELEESEDSVEYVQE